MEILFFKCICVMNLLYVYEIYIVYESRARTLVLSRRDFLMYMFHFANVVTMHLYFLLCKCF